MSCTFRKSGTIELIGCTFFTTRKRDSDYEVAKYTSLASRHNIAAEITMEKNPECPQVRSMMKECYFLPPHASYCTDADRLCYALFMRPAALSPLLPTHSVRHPRSTPSTLFNQFSFGLRPT